MSETDPDLSDINDLLQDVKSYTISELNQLMKMTTDVRDHWKNMLKEIPDDKEGLKMAIQMSIKQAEDDIETITKELAGRGN
jgi:hypothetical protein